MKQIFLYSYKANWYDDIDDTVIEDSGIIAAFSYTNATKRLEEYYRKPNGETCMIDFYLSEIDSFEGLGIVSNGDLKEMLEVG